MRLRYVGFAEQLTHNPIAPPEAVFHVDIASASLDVPADPNLHFEGGLYRGRKTMRPGYYVPTGNVVYPIDIETIAYILKWALGKYQFTEGVGTNTHEIWSAEELLLPEFTARLGKDVFEHVFTDCVVNSLELKVEGEYFYVTINIVGGKDWNKELKAIVDLKLPNAYPLSFVDTSMTLGEGEGSGYNCKFKGLTISIANNLAPDAGKGFGSRFPCRLPIGQRNVNISGSLFFGDDTEYIKFWGHANGIPNEIPEVYPTIENLAILVDSGELGSMLITLPKFVFTQLTTPPSGRTEIIQGFNAIGLVGTVEDLIGDIKEVDTDIFVKINNVLGDLDEDIVS